MQLQVRVVYFDIADTILDTEVQTRLGMQSLFDQDDGTADWTGDWTITGPPRVKLAGEAKLSRECRTAALQFRSAKRADGICWESVRLVESFRRLSCLSLTWITTLVKCRCVEA